MIQAYFLTHWPSAAWYNQPVLACSIHCLTKDSRICASHSGWLLAIATSRYKASRSRFSSATSFFDGLAFFQTQLAHVHGFHQTVAGETHHATVQVTAQTTIHAINHFGFQCGYGR